MSKEELLIPQGTDLKIQYGSDLGSNLIHAYIQISEYSDQFILSMWNGYESTGRTPFTIEDIQKLILMAIVHPQFKKNSILILRIFGDADFSDVEVNQTSRIKVPAMAVKLKTTEAEIAPFANKKPTRRQRKQARTARNKTGKKGGGRKKKSKVKKV